MDDAKVPGGPLVSQIVIPLHHRMGTNGDGAELRYVLRSLEANFAGPYEVTIVGLRLPAWIQGVKHLEQRPNKKGLKTALVMAAAAYPQGFHWWYDDCFLIRRSTPAELRVTPGGRELRGSGTIWSQQLLEIRKRLEKEGLPTRDYSHAHGPYWFNGPMIRQAKEDWGPKKFIGKFPFESWILNKHRWPIRYGAVKQYYGPDSFKSEPKETHWFVNCNGSGWTEGLRKWLDERFPEPSRFEKDTEPPARENIRKEVTTVARPALPAVPWSGVVVHTLRWGAAWWVERCGRTLDEWCARHGHRLRVWGEEDINPHYPTAKFAEVDMLREFLAGDASWLFYVDADVFVSASAPALPDLTGKSGFLLMPDPPGKASAAWPRWVGRRFEDPENLRAGWTYRNAGVWLCDREGARRLLEVVKEPYRRGYQEQNHWNWWLCQAAAAGMPIHELPVEWNSFAHRKSPAHFHHIAGRRKAAKWNALVEARVIEPAAEFERQFDDSPYEFARDHRGWDTDDLHIHALFLALCGDTRKRGSDRTAVEVGAYRGRSTALFVEALKEGKLGHLHVVEPKPTPELQQVISMAPPGTVTLHRKPYWDTDIGRTDFAYIDGNHKWPAVGDVLRALTWGVPVIACHDTQSWPSMPKLWGAHMAGRMLKDAPGRRWIEDAAERSGMRTERGLLISAVEGVDLSEVALFLERDGRMEEIC